MSLPAFNAEGDLPAGVYPAIMEEVIARFGTGSSQRQTATATLLRVYELARSTNALIRLVIFGSYVTAKAEPNDVDVLLVMREDFTPTVCSDEIQQLFDHQRAADLGASVFWVNPSMVLRESFEDFIAHWQVKRDQTRRGIVEVRP